MSTKDHHHPNLQTQSQQQQYSNDPHSSSCYLLLRRKRYRFVKQRRRQFNQQEEEETHYSNVITSRSTSKMLSIYPITPIVQRFYDKIKLLNLFRGYILLVCVITLLSTVSVYSSAVSSSTSSKKSNISRTTTTKNTKGSSAWLNGIKNGICSAGAAACSKTLLQPIDAIKTIQQYHQQHTSYGGKSLSIWGACREIMNRPGGGGNGGIGAFYSGLSVNVIGAIPSVALYFGVYSYCKERFLASDYGKQHPTVCIAASAAIGNTIASFSRVPYEVLKQQLQTGIYQSTFDALKAVVTTKGMFWNMIFPKGGIAIQMIRDVPYAVVTLLVYESLQSSFNKPTSNSIGPNTGTNKNKVLDFVLGGIAGGIGSYVTNPMDVVKTRLQTNSIAYGGSVLLCSKQIWNEGGAAAFLRGSIPRLIHKVPANAFFFLFYELFRKLLQVE